MGSAYHRWVDLFGPLFPGFPGFRLWIFLARRAGADPELPSPARRYIGNLTLPALDTGRGPSRTGRNQHLGGKVICIISLADDAIVTNPWRTSRCKPRATITRLALVSRGRCVLCDSLSVGLDVRLMPVGIVYCVVVRRLVFVWLAGHRVLFRCWQKSVDLRRFGLSDVISGVLVSHLFFEQFTIRCLLRTVAAVRC